MKVITRVWFVLLLAVCAYMGIYITISSSLISKSGYLFQYATRKSKNLQKTITKQLVRLQDFNLAAYTDEVDIEGRTEAWNTGWETWMAEQARRQEVAREVCEEVTKEDTQKKYEKLLNGERKLHHLLVDEKHKAIYCYIPKTRSSDWKKMWMILTGRSNAKSIDTINTKRAHALTSKMRLAMSTKNVDDLIHKLETYTKVLVVRNPLERLVITYLDKIHSENGQKSFQRQILPFVKKKRKDATLMNLQWPEFIEYILSEKNKKNEHWASYYALCYPCDIDYDVVVKAETFDEDSERFLELIGAPEELHFSSKKVGLQDNFMDPYLAELSQKHLTEIYRYFGIDFELYEYEITNNVTSS